MVLRGSVYLSHETLIVFFVNEVVILGHPTNIFLMQCALINASFRSGTLLSQGANCHIGNLLNGVEKRV